MVRVSPENVGVEISTVVGLDFAGAAGGVALAGGGGGVALGWLVGTILNLLVYPGWRGIGNCRGCLFDWRWCRVFDCLIQHKGSNKHECQGYRVHLSTAFLSLILKMMYRQAALTLSSSSLVRVGKRGYLRLPT
jgi:hypothetical protein